MEDANETEGGKEDTFNKEEVGSFREWGRLNQASPLDTKVYSILMHIYGI